MLQSLVLYGYPTFDHEYYRALRLLGVLAARLVCIHCDPMHNGRQRCVHDKFGCAELWVLEERAAPAATHVPRI